MAALPATIVAAVIPIAMAQGKFQGGITTPTPSGMYSKTLFSPGYGVIGWRPP